MQVDEGGVGGVADFCSEVVETVEAFVVGVQRLVDAPGGEDE